MSLQAQRRAASVRASRRSLLQAEVVRSLSAVRSRVDRVRARATTAAAAGIGVALLVAGAVASICDSVLVGTSTWTDANGREVSEDMYEAAGGLAPFLAQPGLRSGTVTAAVLLVLPFLALAVQALRVGQVVEERRSQQMLIAGATWADLRRLRVARASAAFVRGALLAAPVHLLLWLVLGLAMPAGWRLLPPLRWWMPLIWLLTLAFYLGGAGLAAAVGLVAAVVAIAALLLSLTDHLLGNRRAVASTAALGTEVRRLVRVQALCLLRTAVPVTALGVLVSAVPYSLLLVVGDVSDGQDRWSWAALLPLAVTVVAAALIALVCRVLAAALTGRVRAAAALENSRVP